MLPCNKVLHFTLNIPRTSFYHIFCLPGSLGVDKPQIPQWLASQMNLPETNNSASIPFSCRQLPSWPNVHSILHSFRRSHPNFHWPKGRQPAREVSKALWDIATRNVVWDELNSDNSCIYDMLTQLVIAENELKASAPLVGPPTDLPIDCAAPQYKRILSGKRRETPARVVDVLAFTQEIDVLEIRLAELHGLVDLNIVVEGLCSHRGMRKTSFWEQIRFSDRYTSYIHMQQKQQQQ